MKKLTILKRIIDYDVDEGLKIVFESFKDADD